MWRNSESQSTQHCDDSSSQSVLYIYEIATRNVEDPRRLADIFQNWYSTPVYTLGHWLEATLSNSNPLLHPCRIA